MRELSVAHRHISVGDIARLGRQGRMPVDMPTRLMACLARHKRGTVFSDMTANLLAAFLKEQLLERKSVSVDGFPSSPDHLKLLPQNSRIIHITSGEQTRESRLEERGNTSVRKWVKGGLSERDMLLIATLDQAKNLGFSVEVIENNGDLNALRMACEKLLTNQSSPQH